MGARARVGWGGAVLAVGVLLGAALLRDPEDPGAGRSAPSEDFFVAEPSPPALEGLPPRSPGAGEPAPPGAGRTARRARPPARDAAPDDLRVRVVVRGTEGTPALVRLLDRDSATLDEGTTDDGGRITLSGPPDAGPPWTVEATADGYTRCRQRVGEPGPEGVARTVFDLVRAVALSGRVEGPSGRGVAGVRVLRAGGSDAVTTGPDGRFSDLRVAATPGEVTLVVEGFDYASETRATVPGGASRSDLVLVWPPPGSTRVVSGRALLPDGRPAAGAWVRYADGEVLGDREVDAPDLGSTHADAGGRFRLRAPAWYACCTHTRGAGSVLASLPGYADARSPMPRGRTFFDDASPVTATLHLLPGREVTGRVVWSEGTPAPGLEVEVRPTTCADGSATPSGGDDGEPPSLVPPLAEARTDREGRFRLVGVPVAELAVHVQDPRPSPEPRRPYASWRAWRTVPEDGDAVVLVLPCGPPRGGGGEDPGTEEDPASRGAVRARLLVPAGLEPEDCDLRLEPEAEDSGEDVDEDRDDVDLVRLAGARFAAGRVPAGRWRIEPRVLGDAAWTADPPVRVRVEDGGVTDVEVRIVRGTWVPVEVVGVEGDEEAVLEVRDDAGGLRSREPVAEDDEVLLPPGRLRLVLRWRGEPVAESWVRVGAGEPPTVRFDLPRGSGGDEPAVRGDEEARVPPDPEEEAAAAEGVDVGALDDLGR